MLTCHMQIDLYMEIDVDDIFVKVIVNSNELVNLYLRSKK